MVFERFPLINLVPWEAILSNGYVPQSKAEKPLFDDNLPGCKFLYEINKKSMAYGDHIFYLCDVVTSAVVVDCTVAMKRIFLKAKVLTAPMDRRGEVVVSEVEAEEDANLVAVEEFDTWKVMGILEEAVKAIQTED